MVEPVYRYLAHRSESPHTVAVDWDLSRATTLDPPEPWRQTTGQVRASFLAGLGAAPIPAVEAPALYGELSSVLARKRQLILFGPPGTGKTYTARRFAVRHLQQRNGLR